MKMVQILLVIIVGTADIARGIISEKAMCFVKGMSSVYCKFMCVHMHLKIIPEFVKVRVNNDAARLSKIEEYKENIVAQKRRAALKNK